MRLGMGLGLPQKQLRGFVPSILFSAGEKGVWYDPSDLSTLFQDAAGTTPVTAAGQPVGKILDKSGNGAHATQSTATSRPILGLESGRYYLTFDGVDDWLSTAAIDFTGTAKMTVVAGVRKLSDAAGGSVAELSTDAGANNGACAIRAPSAAASDYQFSLRGTALSYFLATTFAAPVSSVLSVEFDISGASRESEIFPRVNQSVPSLTGGGGANAGSGNFGNYAMYVGRRGGTALPFNGRLYGLIMRGAASSDAQIAAAETYINSKTGAY